MNYCERCEDLGITQRATDEIWCEDHYHLWLLTGDNPAAPDDPDDLDEWIRLHERILNRIGLCSDLDRCGSLVNATCLRYWREWIMPLLPEFRQS